MAAARRAALPQPRSITTQWVAYVWYICGVTKTTVYLTAPLKRALARMARQRGCSEAELLREAVAQLTAPAATPPPRVPLFRSTGPSIAEDVDAALAGFGRS